MGEFFSIVEGDGFDEGPWYCAEGVYDRAGYGVGSSVVDFARQEVAVFAFDQSEDGRTALPAQYKVGFPVAGTASAMDDLRALLDAHAASRPPPIRHCRGELCGRANIPDPGGFGKSASHRL